MKKYKQVNVMIISIILVFLVSCTLLLLANKQMLDAQIKGIEQSETVEKESFEIWTIEGSMEEALEAVLAGYENQYPEVGFKVRVFKEEIYLETLTSAARTGDFPDMFYTWGNESLEILVQLNLVQSLTLVISQDVKEMMNEKELEKYTFNNEVYGMHSFALSSQSKREDMDTKQLFIRLVRALSDRVVDKE